MSNPAHFSRRHLLAGSAGLGGALLIAGAGRQTAFGQDATPEAEHKDHQGGGNDPAMAGVIASVGPWTSEDLREPEVRSSVDGVLETELHVRYAYNDVGGYQLYTRTYEGTLPGPTLRVQPGDTLRINLANELPPNRTEALLDADLPQLLNTTNFHFHGSHVSPEGNSDNIFRTFDPGKSYEIEIELPGDTTRGTYWYPPH